MVTQQPIFFYSGDESHVTATEYLALNSRNLSWHATPAQRQNSIPTGGKFVKMNIKIDTAPGTAASGKKYTFGLYVNGTLSTTLKGDIEDLATTLTVEMDQIVAAGDIVSIESDPTSSPLTFGRLDGNIIWEPTTDDEYLILGSEIDSLASNNTDYTSLENSGNANSWVGSEANRFQICGAAGTIKKLHTAMIATPGVGESYTISLRVNQATPTDPPENELNDTLFDKVDNTNTAAVSAGDRLTLRSIGSSGATSTPCNWSCVFVPTTAGEIPIIGGTNDNMSNTTIEYNTFGSEAGWTTLPTREIEVVGETITLKALYIRLNQSPGGGTDYDFDVLKDGVVQAGLNVKIENGAILGNAVDQSIDIADGEKFALEVDPTGPPTIRDAFFGIVFTFGAAPAANTKRSFIPAVIG